MPRPLRVQVADGLYHVTARAARSGFLFPSPLERELFESVLMIALPAASFECHAYCLMGTHYHLLLRTREPNLGHGMKRLNWLYAWRFNRRFGMKGHAFESRYGAELIESTEHLHSAIRYIALNPVEAGLCASPLAWPWSSYGPTLGVAPCPEFLSIDFVLREFGPTVRVARRELRGFVESTAAGLAA